LINKVWHFENESVLIFIKKLNQRETDVIYQREVIMGRFQESYLLFFCVLMVFCCGISVANEKPRYAFSERGLQMKNYQFLIHEETVRKAADYLEKIRNGGKTGRLLHEKLADLPLDRFAVDQLIEKLLQTKKPQIFAESAVRGDGSDWNQTELSILGDISAAVPVQVFDNGIHSGPDIHDPPFNAVLLFTPGALLAGCACDKTEIAPAGRIDSEAYYQLYRRRLLPVLGWADKTAGEKGRKAFITIPGLGCGMFAGPFKGLLDAELDKALRRLLSEHGNEFKNIRAICYGTYDALENARESINQIIYLVRPFLKGNKTRSQLSRPGNFAEADDNFSDCILMSIVAWDHVSWPGNDFYIGSRATDDGVKAAATSSMFSMTGIEGKYDRESFSYKPLPAFRTWSEVVKKNALKLEFISRPFIYSEKN